MPREKKPRTLVAGAVLRATHDGVGSRHSVACRDHVSVGELRDANHRNDAEGDAHDGAAHGWAEGALVEGVRLECHGPRY